MKHPMTVSQAFTFTERMIDMYGDEAQNMQLYAQYEDQTVYGIDDPCSWRGSYCEPSLNCIEYGTLKEGDHNNTLGDFINVLNTIATCEFEGYKGGDYRYDMCSSLWADGHGTAGEHGLVGIEERDGAVYLIIDDCEY